MGLSEKHLTTLIPTCLKPMREFPVVPKFDNKKISNHYGGEDFALLMKDTKWLVGDKYSLSVLLDSSNSVEKLCDEWVLSTSVWVARSPVDFCYATTEAERRPLVVSVPIPLRTQRARAPTRRKAFLRNYGKQKKSQRTLTTNNNLSLVPSEERCYNSIA